MNNLVFNNVAKKLNTTICGVYDDSVYKPIAVDSNGMFLFSPQSIITITASNLDIRHLNFAIDSVTVTATDLDIRNLDGTKDSVAVSQVGFVEGSVTQTVSGTQYLLTTEIANYTRNSFFLRNTGGGTVTVTLQIAPVDNEDFYINATTPAAVSASNNIITNVSVPIRFARLRVQATNTGVIAYYNGQA